MSLDPEELAAQIEQTIEYIAADPTTITLTPRTKTTTAGGVKFIDQPPRLAQQFKIVTQGGLAAGRARPILTIDGVERTVEFTLIGMPDAQIARYDYWVSGGVRFEVLEVQPFEPYQTKALVERRG